MLLLPWAICNKKALSQHVYTMASIFGSFASLGLAGSLVLANLGTACKNNYFGKKVINIYNAGLPPVNGH
jgi:hypothetical protein